MSDRKFLAAVGIALVLLCSCSSDRWAEVQSDTDWDGYFDNRSVAGSGNREISMPSEGRMAAVVQKMTDEGTLSVRLVEEGWLFWPEKTTDWITTSAPYGVVDVWMDP